MGVAFFEDAHASPDISSETWGRGRRFGMLPIGNGRVFWYATLNCAAGEQDRAGERKENLLRLFAGWREPIEQLIAATDEGAILRNDIFDRRPVRSLGRGRVTLLGDAAHPPTPNPYKYRVFGKQEAKLLPCDAAPPAAAFCVPVVSVAVAVAMA